jgi:hypothetical protein
MAYTTIDDSSAYFQTALYTGTGSANNAITNDGNSDLRPDWIWFKSRDAGHSHYVVDSSRGRALGMYPDGVNSEVTSSGSTTDCQSFNSNGFTVGTPEDANSTNSSSSTKVAWQWKANGGTTASNTAGNITSTVQVNSTAGFSIVTWTGNENSSATVGHGLGVKPDMVFFKRRNATYNWAVYHKDATNGQQPFNVVTYLDLTDATGIASNSWGTVATDITSNTFYLKYWFNISSTLVAYCFAEKQGYSRFGKYVGNGNANGTFIYTGFKPAFVLFKNSSNAGENWIVYDNKRDPYNEATLELFPNSTAPEYTANAFDIDILSNGFKQRGANTGSNGVNRTYIYMAFAENPFVTSTGVPTTAR